MRALARQAEEMPPARDFASALRGATMRVIAEVKRASPSKGPIRLDLDAAALAREYATAGAAAISVLTQEEGFRGSLDDLAAVRKAVELPVLRKDFIVEVYQAYEARAYGADAILLIVAALSPDQLKDLLALAHTVGLAVLAESHGEREVEEAVAAGAQVVGINNRNLKDFTVDIETTLRLRPLIPAGVVTVSESGIRTASDVRRLRDAGVDAVLVGESLVASDNPGAKLRELLM